MDATTPFSTLIEAFFKRVESDRSFFNYLNLADDEAMQLANMRAYTYLKEACAIMMVECRPSVNFFDTDEENECFNFELNGREIFLISSIMYEMYLDRDIAKLKTLSVNYTSTDLRVFDPSNARKTFMSMFQFVCARNQVLKNEYSESDRDTGAFLGVDFGAYDGE